MHNVFDSVTCINSIIYLKNLEELCQAISEMSRVLKSEGRLYITTWNILHPYWATSVVLNHLLRRGKRFGEVSPFLATDSRAKNGKTTMYVPTMAVLKKVCRGSNIAAYVSTGPEFVGNYSTIMRFHPNVIISGTKGDR